MLIISGGGGGGAAIGSMDGYVFTTCVIHPTDVIMNERMSVRRTRGGAIDL